MCFFRNHFSYTRFLEWAHYLLECRNVFCHCSANTNVFIIHLILDQALSCVMLSLPFLCLFVLMNTHEPDSECRPVVLHVLGRKENVFHFFWGAKLVTGSHLNDSIISSPFPGIHVKIYCSTLHIAKWTSFLTLFCITVLTHNHSPQQS